MELLILDKAAIPVHLHIEVVKILDFDELNEVRKAL